MISCFWKSTWLLSPLPFPPGKEHHKNDPSITVDYNTADPVVRWDSYENFNLRHQDSMEGETRPPSTIPSLSSLCLFLSHFGFLPVLSPLCASLMPS